MERFFCAFSIVLAICSSFSFLIIYSENNSYRYHRHFRYYSQDAFQTILEADSDRLWQNKIFSDHIGLSQRISPEQRTQNVIYTGDFPEFGVEYLLPSWNTPQPYCLRVMKNPKNRYFPSRNMMRDLLEVEK